MMQIEHYDQLERWAQEHSYFQDGRVISMTPIPGLESDAVPTAVTVELGYPIKGTYEANSEMVYRAFRLLAQGVTEYYFDSEWQEFSFDGCINGLDTMLAAEGIDFLIDIPPSVRLKCSVVHVVELPQFVELVKPEPNEAKFTVVVSRRPLPAPAHWVGEFARRGIHLAWHVLGGQPVDVASVPSVNYEGWFLQDPGDLSDKKPGLLFDVCRATTAGFSVSLERRGLTDRIWHAAMESVEAFAPAMIQIQSGNCSFTLEEWKTYRNSLGKSGDVDAETAPRRARKNSPG
ncbi:hypothetical protein [Leptonema illini]|uniref:Uncharacterized protein n=1 Tax=Leptonema illini DSM 21528 TaxID=929563 RepID=H2CJ54_9LEPT|nr:hypothetical protein [Leptonema illini]EHQ04971.1 hypothetical protein Lepil_0264 [Leptonema illini DSM 21528]